MRLLPLPFVVLVLACSAREESSAALVRDAVEVLARRDVTLDSYRYVGLQQQDGAPSVRYRVAFRSPNRMQVELLEPGTGTLSFDGARLFEVDPAKPSFRDSALTGTPAQNAVTLAQRFSPFIPEGFRLPRIQRSALTARKVSHPRAPEAVELSQLAQSDGEAAQVTMVHRWPTMDFLEKRSTYGGTTSVLSVTAEHCQGAKGLCVPAALTLKSGSGAITRTTLSGIELNVPLAAEAFTLAAPK